MLIRHLLEATASPGHRTREVKEKFLPLFQFWLRQFKIRGIRWSMELGWDGK